MPSMMRVVNQAVSTAVEPRASRELGGTLTDRPGERPADAEHIVREDPALQRI